MKWTGADDDSTPAPTEVTGDVHYYAHFSRTPVVPEPMDPSLFTYDNVGDLHMVTGWVGTPPADGYALVLPEVHSAKTINCIAGASSAGSPWSGAALVSSAVIIRAGAYVFKDASRLVSVDLPSLEAVEASAFQNAAALTSLDFPHLSILVANAFAGCTAIQRVTLGPLNVAFEAGAFPDWTFYDTDGTTVLSKTAANLANSTFVGTASKLVKQ